MIQITGYILTLLYVCNLFFPALFRTLPGEIPALAGHAAFGIFALLLARGARRTTNHFLYFRRLIAAAFATGLFALLADRFAQVYFPERNALFSYATSIALISGLSMITGCSQDLVMQAMTAKDSEGFDSSKKDDDPSEQKSPLFGIPVQPLRYRMRPMMGIVAGILTIGAALFSTLFFRFSHGLYGQAFIVLAFVAFRDTPDPREKTQSSVHLIAFRRRMEQTLFEDTLGFRRALLSLSALTLVFLLLSRFPGAPTRFMTPTMPGCLIALPLALLFPEFKEPPSPTRRKATYSLLPACYAVLFVIRLIVGPS
ncbi:MAG: hypothetical protein GX939_01125 [Clostridiaceae bacterium]|nr:hypothetical protein [Clostridiaceae bacterium]